ncbi:TetR/AcrR family transcriptional regulator [Glycomyces paridis]|uniref:TetR/AcrR family transcriptional regulator n=1 Tax=Glycomyces paridis TaxID=2126555 RepID=A0A4S8PDZ5_9ACTN|nr:TetR/AcrR family transcriptional regulator [Glycomyces paridis]THV26499.1 TetR/AcrR family transcriptional regulator [Glycomyces paridis]
MTDSNPPAVARRTPRAEVRRRLREAAAQEFAERGYDESRLEDIAARAGFTKGAVYSNFKSKQELFGSVLADRADIELSAVTDHLAAVDDVKEAVADAARLVAGEITGDTQRGQLGFEFASRARRDEQVRDVLAPLRRSQRQAAAELLAAVAERLGGDTAVEPELAGLIVHCLSNGLSMEHAVDPEGVDGATVEAAIAATLTALLPADRTGGNR